MNTSIKFNGQELNNSQIIVTDSGFEALAKAIIAEPLINHEASNEYRIKRSLMNWFDCEPDDWSLQQAVKEIMEIVSEGEGL